MVVEYPRIKGGACGCICVCVEMLRILLGIIEGFNVLAKLIYDAVHHAFIAFQSYSCQLAIEHQEVRLQEGVHIESFLYGLGFLIHDFKRRHSVYTIHDLVVILVVQTYHIVAVIAPSDSVRAETIKHSVKLESLLLGREIGEVLEANHLVFADCLIDEVDAVIYSCVIRFYSLIAIDITAQMLCLILACQGRELFDQSFALGLRNEACGFYGIDQQLQFGELQDAFSDTVLVHARTLADDIESTLLKLLDISHDGVAVRFYTACFQMLCDV